MKSSTITRLESSTDRTKRLSSTKIRTTEARMDVVTDILRVIRLHGSIFFRAETTSPWGIDFPSINEPRFHVLLGGSAVAKTTAMQKPITLKSGELFFVPRGHAHWIGDSQETKRVPSVEAIALQARDPSTQNSDPSCQILCGIFAFGELPRHSLFEMLPDHIHVTAETSHDLSITTIAELIEQEKQSGTSASTLVIDRLCEVLLIRVMRAYMKRKDSITGFLAALKDPRIKDALVNIHLHPGRPWTLETLAKASGMSRAGFAARFKELVAVSAIKYLTSWRMTKARDYLTTTPMSVADIAMLVGYASEDGFRRAFQREFGVSAENIRDVARDQMLSV